MQTLFSTPTLSALAQAMSAQGEVDIPENRILPGGASITPEMLPLATLSQPEIDAVVAQVPGGVANVQDIYALSPLQEGFCSTICWRNEATRTSCLRCCVSTAVRARDPGWRRCSR
ncbi:hypothetical protein ACKU5C_023545 [Serratia marcescens]